MIKKLKKIMWIYIRFVQKILITIFLTLTYFFIIPFSWIYLVIFKPSKVSKSFQLKKSYWQKVNDLGSDIDDYKMQS